jgi:putative DNA primase/helicase
LSLDFDPWGKAPDPAVDADLEATWQETSVDPLPSEPWTELGHAHRLVHVYGDQLRYVTSWGKWLVWDGRRWALDGSGQVARWAKTIARRLTTDAGAHPDRDERRKLRNLAARGESSAGIKGAITLASTEEGIAVDADQLDAHPQLLNCANGVVDLATGELGPHDPRLLLTKISGARYDPTAAGPEFTKFLERIQPDPAMRRFLARLLGHALEGRVLEHVLPILYGAGANGKGTLVAVVLVALGDYGDAAEPDLLTARHFDAHPTGVADLFGLRLAVLHESDQGRHLAEGTVKRLTGGDRLKARRMRENFWSFDPSHTFALLTNHKPLITGTDEGIWRRLQLVPFDVVIPPGERDEHLGDRLALEADHVLAWLIAGHRDWRRDGLDEPDPVKAATAEYRAESDQLRRFLDQRCLIGPHFHTRSSELYAEWRTWCNDEGENPGTQKAFTTALQNKGFDSDRTRIGVVWRGIGLAATDDGEGL